ncbi:MAG TPA: membrane protein insertase YidC [Ignavibacteriaceae bacterium]|nr:membrane protein insertase YidC [Ignavibacteriaceae bacterium]
MDKRTVFAFILIGAIFITWLYLNTPEPPINPPTHLKDSTQTSQKIDSLKLKQKDTTQVVKTEEVKPEVNIPESITTIETDDAIIELSTKGGNIHKYYLKNHNNWYSSMPVDEKKTLNDYYKSGAQLINYDRGNAFDIAFVTNSGKQVNTAKIGFTTDAKSFNRVTKDQTLIVTYTAQLENNRSIKKTYTFTGNKYDLNADVEMDNFNNQVANNAVDIVWDSGLNFVEENSVDEANYSNASVYYGDEKVIIDATDFDKPIEGTNNGKVEWMSVRNKYFTAIVAPKDASTVDGYYVKGTRVGKNNQGVDEFYSARLNLNFKNNPVEKNSFLIYMGPVNYDQLKAYNKNFEAEVDFGSFFGLKFVVRPIAEYILLPLFTFLHTIIPNYGFVIIVFSIIIKLLMIPLSRKQMQSMQKMQLLQPKIAEIKEKFADDKAKLQKETMKLYSTYGINPAGGCLPLVLQMPIFIALFGLFQGAIELRHQPFMLWITDLSRPDVILHLPFKLPLFNIDIIAGLAVVMGITTFVQQKMTMKDPTQQAMIYIMPVMLTLLFMSWPSGLNLYYFMFNLLSIGQQYWLNHHSKGVVLEPVKNPKKSGGFMEKLMHAAEENAKKAKDQQKRKR